MKDLFSTEFDALSLRDLLEARDAFHVHFIAKQNVVGTAQWAAILSGQMIRIRTSGGKIKAPRKNLCVLWEIRKYVLIRGRACWYL